MALSTGCGPSLPGVDSREYREMVSAFYTGLAALEAGDDARASDTLKRATEIVAGEPAAWANYGLLAIRQRDYDAAAARLGKAAELAPDSAPIAALMGLLESSRGNSAAAVTQFERAIAADPRDLKSIYQLAAEVEREGADGADAKVQTLYEKILTAEPENLAVLLDLARVAAKRGDAETLRHTVEKLGSLASGWPPEGAAQLEQLKAAVAGGDPRASASRVAFLRNVLLRVPEYQSSLASVKLPPQVVGAPIDRFILLASPTPNPAPADTAITFAVEAAPEDTKADWTGIVWATGDDPPAVARVTGAELAIGSGAKLAFPAGSPSTPAGPWGVATYDADYDFKVDLALAGAGGVRLYHQDSANAYSDATAKAGLPADVASASYAGVWPADVDLDGDLDLVLGATEGATRMLSNNGDGTYAVAQPFGDVARVRDLCWGDLDDDGDPDAVLLDGDARVHVLWNERSGRFRPATVPAELGQVAAVALGDLDADGRLDVLALGTGGTLVRAELDDLGQAFTITPAAERGGPVAAAGTSRLFLADLDNNGALDAVASGIDGTRVWLGAGQGTLAPLDAVVDGRVLGIADLDADGRLDFVGLTADGRSARFANRGTKSYHWQAVRPRAKESTGDQRINSYAVGSDMAVRSGLLYQHRPVSEPVVHFGIGENATTEIVRVVWPNGVVQAEFDLTSDQAVLAEQRLKGSCPWLFAWNGREMGFVTDFIWRSPLGLKINAQATAGVVQTEDWVKIRADQLVARDGLYDLRITADLWETHFFDYLALRVVDHPADEEIFVDERFAIPPPELAVHHTSTPRPVAGAWDDTGADVSAIVAKRDATYLDTFGRGRYQGVTRDHYVEVALPDDAPADRLVLVAHGWIHPTDSSINVALGQGKHDPPTSLSLEVPDGRGGWAVARSGLGFPAGKLKTVLLDLDGVFREGAPRRVRLRTNLEIYWDSIEWAVEHRSRLLEGILIATPQVAELRYRGFSAVSQAGPASPELPTYGTIASTTQGWRDLEGYYTRYGDVRELVSRVDDRYIIMNAGDEIVLRFAEPPMPPPAGWVRDFVLVGDGWVKDGDFNTSFSKTVLPLPSHARADYDTAPGHLEDDPVYRAHPDDWRDFHTRYVTPRAFADALRPGGRR